RRQASALDDLRATKRSAFRLLFIDLIELQEGGILYQALKPSGGSSHPARCEARATRPRARLRPLARGPAAPQSGAAGGREAKRGEASRSDAGPVASGRGARASTRGGRCQRP